MGEIGRISLSRRAALTLLGVAGLAACDQAHEPAAGRQVAGTDAASDSAGRIRPQPGRGCDPPELPPRKAAVLALDADGRQRWRLPLGGDVYDASIRGGILVVRVGPLDRGRLLGVDPASGRVRWRRGLPGPLDLDMNPAVDRLALVTADEVVLVTRGPRGQAPILLAAYRARDGRVGWRVPLQADHWPTWTPDGRLLIVGSPPASTAPKPSLTAVDVRGGRLLWRRALPMNADRPATPLGGGAVIQVWDPPRGCADVGTASVGVGGRSARSVAVP